MSPSSSPPEPTPSDPPAPTPTPAATDEPPSKISVGGSEKPPPAIKYHRPTKPELERYYHTKQGELESERLRLEYGWIARLIGRKSAPRNITFVIVLLVLFAGFVVIIRYPDNYIEFWKIILPILTLTLGYLFGKNTKG